MPTPSARPRRLKGQSVVEFALVSLLLLMMTFGTIDLGRGVYQRQMVTNAVREASRVAQVDPLNQTEMVARAARTSPSLGLTSSNFTFNGAVSGVVPNDCNYIAAAPEIVQSPAKVAVLAGGDYRGECWGHTQRSFGCACSDRSNFLPFIAWQRRCLPGDSLQ